MSLDIASGVQLNDMISPISRDAFFPGKRQDTEDLSSVTYAGIRAEPAELCRCPGAVTQQFVMESGNKCPTCFRPLRNLQSTVRSGNSVTSEEDRETRVSDSGTRVVSSQSFWGRTTIDGELPDGTDETNIPSRQGGEGRLSEKGLDKRLCGVPSGPVPYSVQDPRLVLPRFDGDKDTDVRHFFWKLKACFTDYNVVYGPVQRLYLIDCLRGKALDLYMTLQPEQQTDLRVVEKVFMKHFCPILNKLERTKVFMRSKKENSETVSEYALRLHTEARDVGIDHYMLTQAFVLGLPLSYQKHLALKRLTDMGDIFQECQMYEGASTMDTDVDGEVENTVRFDTMSRMDDKWTQERKQMNHLTNERRESFPSNYLEVRHCECCGKLGHTKLECWVYHFHAF